jgi:hypothetical protein
MNPSGFIRRYRFFADLFADLVVSRNFAVRFKGEDLCAVGSADNGAEMMRDSTCVRGGVHG